MSAAAKIMMPPPTLNMLLAGIVDAPPLAVHGIASDSREVVAGGLFIACQGSRVHALDHLDAGDATLLNAIVWDGKGNRKTPLGVPAIVVPDLPRHVGTIASRYYGVPSAEVRVTGVTGTNGKTTVAWLLAQAWQLLGERCGYLGTLGGGIETIDTPGGLTTPDAVALQRQLADFRDAGAVRAAIEVSSHGLAQWRADGTRLHAAAFTNLSRDHLDYHGSMDAYFDAKARLFIDLAPKHPVICVDDDYGVELAELCGDRVVRVATDVARLPDYGLRVCAESIAPCADGTRVRLTSSWGDCDFTLPLVGRFNVANALQVLALLLVDDVPLARAVDVIGALSAPPGRLQRVTVAGAGLPAVYVDYAHTPAALEAALAALRPHAASRLVVVFGCGGERDRGKRPEMGRAASTGADIAIVTSDNPRGEDPLAIIRETAAGMSGEYRAIEDRATAIALAISIAGEGDVVLIAGKGHEDYQIVGAERREFSDYQAAAENLRRRAQ